MRILPATCTFAALLANGHAVLAAPDIVCSNQTISAGTFHTITIEAATSCTLEGGVVVEHDVKADGAVDVIIDGSAADPVVVGHDVDVENSTGEIVIDRAIVGDKIKLKRNVSVEDITVRLSHARDIEVKENETTDPTSDIEILANTVAGKIKVEKNVSADALEVEENIVDGNIDVKKNVAANDLEVFDNVFVYPGKIKIEKNVAGDRIEVESNLNVEKLEVKKNLADDEIEILDNEVTKDLKIKDNILDALAADGDTGRLEVVGNTVGGKLELKKNEYTGDAGTIDLGGSRGNVVEGDVKVEKNTTLTSLNVENNVIGGDLNCKDNAPAPILAGNIVDGEESCVD